jgi:hypothetical protein
MASKRRSVEGIIHRAVIRHIKARAVPELLAFHIPNGGKRGIREAANFKLMGVLPGIPDLWMLMKNPTDGLPPITYTMEFKAPGKGLSERQLEVRSRLDSMGVFTAVCDNVDAAIRVLEAWGIIRGAAQ